tara:strand:- start:96 stop:452 length:357 start_codon:yes stop_codon:yes gene_type:complete
MRFVDLYLTEDSMEDTISDVEEFVVRKVEDGVLSSDLDEFVDDLNDSGTVVSKSVVRQILEKMPEYVINVDNTKIEFKVPGNLPDEMVPEPQDVEDEDNVTNLATSAANQGIGDELNV